MSTNALGCRPVIGVLHPGAMGAAIGSALKPVAGAVVWAAAGRSPATARRAELADLVGVPDVAAVVRRCDLIISICPPHVAVEVAEQVAAALPERSGPPPLYLDVNAVSPGTVRRIGTLLGPAALLVDGAVIGPPAWEPGQTVLWVSGPGAAGVAALFGGSPFDARVLGPDLGTASALKLCFALQSKALPAIWLVLADAAESAGVDGALRAELARFGVDFADEVARIRQRAEAKAWRWAGEMDEAAAAMAELGVPAGFSVAAAEVYRRVADEASGG